MSWLAQKLIANGPLKTRDLERLTNLSQPQLSRYIKKLGTKIITIGKGRNTQYAHTREIPQVGFHIPIFRITQEGKLEESGSLFPIFPKGFYWKSINQARSKTYHDLPYFLNDLRPSGFLGRLIPKTYPEWGFPQDIRLWSADSTLRYLTHFGIDLIGDQIMGEAAAQKFLSEVLNGVSLKPGANEIDEYEIAAHQVQKYGMPGSSAGGEHSKFLIRRITDGVPVIVKFVLDGASDITKRRIDLLRAEHIASGLFSESASTTSTRILEGSAHVFLEITRFDRVGFFGRRGVISLFSLDAEFAGSGENWSAVAERLHQLGILNDSIVEEIQLREYFGHFIGNSDMHGGNLSFFFEKEEVIDIAPVYDMLPMRYAPVQERISCEPIAIFPPKPAKIHLWEKARNLAIKYWGLIKKTREFTPGFLELAERNERILAERGL